MYRTFLVIKMLLGLGVDKHFRIRLTLIQTYTILNNLYRPHYFQRSLSRGEQQFCSVSDQAPDLYLVCQATL
jgi:hypothetical protein